MNMKMKALAVLVALVFCAGCAAQKAAGPGCKSMVNVQKYKQKAENFLVLFDSSETMSGKAGEKLKLAVAKDAVTCMNQCIPPDVKLNAGLRTFGHGYYLFSIFQTDLIYGMTAYSQDGLKGALCKIDSATGNTPMVKAINAAAEDLKGVQGRTALILVTDGSPTDGDAVAAAGNLKKAMGDTLCIYAIQIGDDYTKKMLLEKIVKAGGCGFVANAGKLAGCEPMTDFVERVLFDKCITDTDGDAVCEENDKCPGTPRGAQVDERGCWSAVLFDYNQAVIKKSARPVLDQVAAVLSAPENLGVSIVIQGHTDSTGSESYNMALSSKRARAVKAYLLNKGIKSSRLATKGYGDGQPIDSNDTAAGRAKNRRVEFAAE
ncbi:MAG: OmpA family protein [Deltaproteobacteria bacterium]|nr:OmpA family protein [Deltaproteobacteria bacterium]